MKELDTQIRETYHTVAEYIPVPDFELQEKLQQKPRGKWIPRLTAYSLKTACLAMIMMSGLFLVSPSFATIAKQYWYNMQIDWTQQEEGITPSTIEDSERLSQILQRLPDEGKILTLEEAQKVSEFPIQRPIGKGSLPLVKAQGSLRERFTKEMAEKKVDFQFWDVFMKDGQWVMVTQSYSQASSDQILKGQLTFPLTDGKKAVEVPNRDAFAWVVNQGEMNQLNMYVKVNTDQIIYMQMFGNVNEEELIRIASRYR